MTYQLYSLTTGLPVGPERRSPFSIDGVKATAADGTLLGDPTQAEVTITRLEAPAYDTTTQKLESYDTLNLAARTRTIGYNVVPLTAAELAAIADEAADAAEAEQLKAVYSALLAGTATAAQQRRVLAFLLKCEAKRRGLVPS